MTAFADYADLRIAVSEQVGNRDISDVLDRRTKAAEAWFNREVRCREQLTIAPVVFVAGVATIPADFLEVSMLDDGFEGSMAQANRALTGQLTFSVDATGIYIKELAATRQLEYYAKLPTLTTSPTTSNWLLQKSPNLYLYAVSSEVSKWLSDVDKASAFVSLRDDEMRSLGWSDVRGRYGASVVTTGAYGP